MSEVINRLGHVLIGKNKCLEIEDVIIGFLASKWSVLVEEDEDGNRVRITAVEKMKEKDNVEPDQES